MRKWMKYSLFAVVFFGFWIALSVSLQSNQANHPVTADHPLPACRLPSNCVKESRFFTLKVDELAQKVVKTLNEMKAVEITDKQQNVPTIHAVFSAAMIFRDDVDIALIPTEHGTMLHIRSSSRVGRGDFGANSRRVRRFFAHLTTIAK